MSEIDKSWQGGVELKKVRSKLIRVFVLVMLVCWGLTGMKAYGKAIMILLDDTGSSPASWYPLVNKMNSTSSLSGGPPSGNPGSYYYFITSGGSRDVSTANVKRDLEFSAEQKVSSSLGQLKVDFYMDIYGWSNDYDKVKVLLYGTKGGVVSTAAFYDSGFYTTGQAWVTIGREGMDVPAGSEGLRVEIFAVRQDGSDLDVYIDNVRLYLSDETPAAITEATVTEIRDINNQPVPLNKDAATGLYMDNWVNTTDTISGSIKFNEYVALSYLQNNLYTNILNTREEMKYGNFGSSTGTYSLSHGYQIPLSGADKLRTKVDTVVQLYYYPNNPWGPFTVPVYDIGSNYGLSTIVKPNIDSYNIKLDNASPTITTQWSSYESYDKTRTGVNLIICEENRGTAQSPLTLTYYWEYLDKDGKKVTDQRKLENIGIKYPKLDDGSKSIYTVGIDIPNENDISDPNYIPPYQDFRLYAEINDDARNNGANRVIYRLVKQKDETPPKIQWEKSLYEDGTSVDIRSSEDMRYSKTHKVTFTAADAESGVYDVKYLWTSKPYDPVSDTFTKSIAPTDGKYTVEGTSLDAPLEGLYYLNILTINNTQTSTVVSKGFYFDNQGPRVSGSTEGTNPKWVQYKVQDRALQGKFLYTLLAADSGSLGFESVTEPDISRGIMDNGMWKALDLSGTGNTELTAAIGGVLDKITQSGYYKLVTRYYDGLNNYTQNEEMIWYDFVSPVIEVTNAGSPDTYLKNHEAVFKVNDNISGTDLSNMTVSWIDADSGEAIPASFVVEPQLLLIKTSGQEAFNGSYYLRVRVADYYGNITDEKLSLGGSLLEFHFDNSPPAVNISQPGNIASRNISFSYSGLKDDYTDISTFKYGISASPAVVPSEWIDIPSAESAGEVDCPKVFTTDGTWYLYVMLRDALGNEKIISQVEPYRIDVTKPSGHISFSEASGYSNKLNVLLQLGIQELETDPKAKFTAILSGSRSSLEDETTANLLPTTEIYYEYGLAAITWQLMDIADGEQKVYARFRDQAGNLSDIYEASIILDRTAPTGSVSYDMTGPTAGNVTATLTMMDNYNAALLNNNQTMSYVFNRNGEFEFVLSDLAGNKARVRAAVNNIDTDAPKAAITYSMPGDIWTNQSVIATLTLEDVNGSVVLGDGSATRTFNENGQHVFLFSDALGNQSSIVAEVRNIDKTAPTGSIVYTNSDTAPVTVYLTADEAVKVTNNSGSFRYIFDANGLFTFEFEDKAGNISTATASVGTITSADRYVDLNYYDTGGLTKENVYTEFIPVSGLACITDPTVTEEVYGPYPYSFSDNGMYPVAIRIFSGSEADSVRTVAGSVYNIDRSAPEALVYLSTEELTNEDVVATLLTYDDKGKTVTITNNNGESEYTFMENGTFTFDFVDEAGNIGHKEIAVSNIDKSVPSASIMYYTDPLKEHSIFAEISFPEETEVTIVNNNGSDTYEFVENGAYTFKYSDKAGNEGYTTAQVTSLSDNVSEGSIEYYIEGIKVDDPNSIVTNKAVAARLILPEAGSPYTIVNNEGSDTCTFEQNGEFTFVYEDSNRNRGFATARVSGIDKEAPALQIIADIARATNRDVTVTVSYSDNKGIADVLHNMEAENTVASEGKLVYTCRANKTIQVTVTDTAGNTTAKEFTVDYIDKVAPTGSLSYYPAVLTNSDVKAVLSLNEQGTILNNSGRNEYVFSGNGSFAFEFADAAGNNSTVTAVVDWIDKIAPELSLAYSSTVMTNKPVTVTLAAETDAIILNNGGSPERIFNSNGEYIFRVSDKAGNESRIKAVVGNIDTEKPSIVLKGYDYTSILQDETYIEPGYSANDNTDGDITGRVVVEGSVNTSVPGIYILRYVLSDSVGNRNETIRTVKVLGPEEIVPVLNGRLIGADQVILNTCSIKLECTGNEGSYIIKWAEGKRTQAYFKGQGNIVPAGGTVNLPNNNWYTIFMQDRERKTKSIQVYINE